MICLNCGHQNKEGAKFCIKCGEQLSVNNVGNQTLGTSRQSTYSSGNAVKKQSNALLYVVIVAIVVALGVFGFIAYDYISSNSSIRNSDVESREVADRDSEEKEEKEEEEAAEAEAEKDAQLKETEAKLAEAEAKAAEAETKAAEAEAKAEEATQAAETAKVEAAEEVKAISESANNSDISIGYYIIPDSSSRYLTSSDIAGFSTEELKLARNEIYARHGRKFKNNDLQNYFNSQNWYTGTIPADEFSETLLNDFEKKNIQFILSAEK